MKTSSVYFANTQVEQILDHETKQKILEKIRSITNFDILSYHKHCKVLRKEDMKLLEFPHVMSFMTRGQSYWMFLTRLDMYPMGLCILISKKIKPGYPYPKMLCLPYQFQESNYHNTLLEVEVVEWIAASSKRSVLLLDNVIVYENRLLDHSSVMERFNYLYGVASGQREVSSFPCPLQVKRLFSIRQLDRLCEISKRMEYPIYGILFLPVYHTTVYPKLRWEDSFQEMKNEKALTLDEFRDEILKDPSLITESMFYLLIKKTMHPDVYHVYLEQESDKLVYYDVAHIPSLEISKQLRQWYREDPHRMFVMCHCRYFPQFHKFGIMEVHCIEGNPEVFCLEKYRFKRGN